MGAPHGRRAATATAAARFRHGDTTTVLRLRLSPRGTAPLISPRTRHVLTKFHRPGGLGWVEGFICHFHVGGRSRSGRCQVPIDSRSWLGPGSGQGCPVQLPHGWRRAGAPVTMVSTGRRRARAIDRGRHDSRRHILILIRNEDLYIFRPYIYIYLTQSDATT